MRGRKNGRREGRKEKEMNEGRKGGKQREIERVRSYRRKKQGTKGERKYVTEGGEDGRKE